MKKSTIPFPHKQAATALDDGFDNGLIGTATVISSNEAARTILDNAIVTPAGIAMITEDSLHKLYHALDMSTSFILCNK